MGGSRRIDRARWLPAAAAFLASWSCACGSERGEGAHASDTPASVDLPEAGAAVTAADAASAESGEPASEGQVVLESPGGEPRRVFRYAFQVGTKEILAMNMHMDMSMSAPGSPAGRAAPTLPAVQMRSTFEAVRLTPEGHALLHFRLDSADVAEGGGDPSVRPALERIHQLVGMVGDYEVTDRGDVLRASFTVPPGLDSPIAGLADQMRRSVRTFFTRFPDEAIGVGAAWKDTRVIQLPMLTLHSALRYSLKEVDERGGTVDVSMLMTAPPQPMVLPAGSPRVTIEAMSIKGHVTRRFDLGLPAPYSEDMETTSDDDMSFEANGAVHPVHMSMATTLHLERAQ